MAEHLDIALTDILVDPAHVSARYPHVDEAYLARLTEALDHGAQFPALQVARVTEPGRPEWAGVAPHSKPSIAARLKRQAEDQFANLAPLPEWVLVDGHARYWALRARDIARYVCLVAPLPVACLREAELLALEANAHNARQLTDVEMMLAVVRLYLGHYPEPRETWAPERGAIASGEIARRLGYSERWVYNTLLYAQVRHAIALEPLGLELPKSHCVELGRLEERLWRSVVWSGDQLRLHGVEGRNKVGAMLNVTEMTVRQLHAVVDRLLSGQSVISDERLPTPQPKPTRSLIDVAHYDGTLPLIDWDEYRTTAEQLHSVARKLDNAQLLAAIEQIRPAHISSTAAYQELVKEAVRRGLQLDVVAISQA